MAHNSSFKHLRSHGSAACIDQVEVIDSWPGNQKARDAVPCVLSYNGVPKKVLAWGASVKNDHIYQVEPYGLLTKQERPALVPEKTAVQVASDFISQVVEYVSRFTADKYRESVVENQPICHVFIIPDTFKNNADTSLQRAAAMVSRVKEFTVITEFEALASLSATYFRAPMGLGSRFLGNKKKYFAYISLSHW